MRNTKFKQYQVKTEISNVGVDPDIIEVTGFKVVKDESISDGEIHFRKDAGEVVGKIINVGHCRTNNVNVLLNKINKIQIEMFNKKLYLVGVSEWEWGIGISFIHYQELCSFKMYFKHTSDHSIIMYGLYVLEEYRKEGLGKEMVQLAESIAINLKFENIQLYVQENSWMHNWYNKLGYKDNGVYEGEEQTFKIVWMFKKL